MAPGWFSNRVRNAIIQRAISHIKPGQLTRFFNLDRFFKDVLDSAPVTVLTIEECVLCRCLSPSFLGFANPPELAVYSCLLGVRLLIVRKLLS